MVGWRTNKKWSLDRLFQWMTERLSTGFYFITRLTYEICVLVLRDKCEIGISHPKDRTLQSDHDEKYVLVIPTFLFEEVKICQNFFEHNSRSMLQNMRAS
jgi:hypothetical protein